jgi:hypothetical protein
MHGGALQGRWRNGGDIGALHEVYRAASWTAWGYFIARLFQLDPEARVGQYNGLNDFRYQCERMHEISDKHYSDISFLNLEKTK